MCFLALTSSLVPMASRITLQHFQHGATTHAVPENLERYLRAAGSDVPAASHLVSHWADTFLAPSVKASRCNLCEKGQAAAVAMNVDLKRAVGAAGTEPDVWAVTYLLCCEAPACTEAAQTVLLEVQQQQRLGADMKRACITCLATDDLLMNKGNGAYYCPAHRPADAAPPVLKCAACGATGRTLGVCACKQALYCDKACQKAHRKGHKTVCDMALRVLKFTK